MTRSGERESGSGRGVHEQRNHAYHREQVASNGAGDRFARLGRRPCDRDCIADGDCMADLHMQLRHDRVATRTIRPYEGTP